MVELVDTRDLKSLASNGVPVQVRLRVPISSMNIKVIVLDRDGTLIKHIPYLHNPSDVSLLPGVKDAFKVLFENKIKIFMHTNQSGINRNYFNLTDALACNDALFNLLSIKVSDIDGVCIAPETPNEESVYRKPSPNFGNEILKNYKIEPKQLYYVGDSICDLETAHNLSCKAAGVNTGLKNLQLEMASNPSLSKFPIFSNFYDAISFVIND